MVVHVCNPSSWEEIQENGKFKVIFGIVSLKLERATLDLSQEQEQLSMARAKLCLYKPTLTYAFSGDPHKNLRLKFFLSLLQPGATQSQFPRAVSFSVLHVIGWAAGARSTARSLGPACSSRSISFP